MQGGGVQSLRAEAPQEANNAVSGVVSDADGPIIGASVVEKGNPSNGVSTDVDGKYTLRVSPNAILVVSYLGYASLDVAVSGRTTINVTLAEDAKALEEVVVIGYGTTRKQDLSMAVTTVKLDQSMKSRPGAGVASVLQGKVPGMTIQKDGGDPLKGESISIRGKGSRDNDNVLWIVDGVPGGLYSVDDIETVTILKDAASAAIYGSQVGAGGVLIITTKKAQAGKTKIEANVSYGVKSAYKLPEVVTAEQYMQVWDATIKTSTSGRTLADAQNPDAYPYGNKTRTDWVDEVFRTAAVQHYSVSLSGGTETLKTFASVAFDKNDGILLNTYSKGLNAKVQLDYQPAKWIKISERGAFSSSNGQGDVENSSHSGVLMAAIFYPRSATVYEHNADGSIVMDEYGNKVFGGTFPVANPQGVLSSYGNVRNPVASLLRLRQNRPSYNVHSTSSLEIKPIAALTFRSDYTATVGTGRKEYFYPSVYELGAAGDTSNERDVESYLDNSWLWENTASYAQAFGEHSVSAMAGYTAKYSTGRNNRTHTYNFLKEDEHYATLGNGENYAKSKPEEGIWEESMTSAFGRIGYSYNDRYFATGSIRKDATSKLAPENNSGIFNAFSASWKISSEAFFNVPAINLLKLRGGWGQIGNAASVDRYSYFAALKASGQMTMGNDYHTIQGTYVATIPNRLLTWESTEQTSFGLDASLLDNSLSITIDYFDKITQDLIDTKQLPPMAGYDDQPKGNTGKVSNKGWEFSAAYTKTVGEVTLHISGNLSTVKNEVLAFNNGKMYNHSESVNGGTMQPLRSEVGQPWWSYKLIKTDGIFQSQDEVDAYTWKNPETGAITKIQQNAQPGDLKFIDFNNDGRINDDDRQYMGSYLPDLTYGFNLGLDYKGFDFNAFFQGVGGTKIFNGFKMMGLVGRSANSYFLKDALKSWTFDHTSDIPRLALFEDPNNNFNTASDFLLEDGAYLRLKNVTIGYTLPKSLMSKAGMNTMDLRIYASAENLLTFTNYTGFDPEVGRHGLDAGTYPVARAFNVGLNLSF
ncbi:SusC/RagA family TonB-linked outer membrane protein [Bacteroidia bacterium]|nr:SusC/RagA family TonB-linked outer membrane protein [Bacteroidia bacterium]